MPTKRGASRSSRVSGAGCGGRDQIVRRAMGSRTAKSCGSDSPMLESSLSMIIGRRWWLTSPVHQGEREAAVKTIAQGMPGVSAALSLLACAKCTFFARKARGCSQHPAFPAPSFHRGRDLLQTLDAFAPRECGVVSLRLFDSLNMKRRRYPFSSSRGAWIASQSLSTGAHSRDPLARNDGRVHQPSCRRPA